jgi:hypothetical protein
MRLFFSNKAGRLLLSVSVSIWMAGGCLFGCSSNADGAEVAQEIQNSVASSDSCHAKRPHDCCTKPKPKKQVGGNFKQLEGLASLMPVSGGMMRDCPLIVNSTAAPSKSYTHVPDPARASIAALPRFEKQTAQTDHAPVVPLLPNRGPTHLRCCVFLI